MKSQLEDMVHQSENMRRLWIMKGGEVSFKNVLSLDSMMKWKLV